jgi:hypothetical protein
MTARPAARNYNATVVYEIVLWQSQINRGAKPEQKTSRARVTAKRIFMPTRTYDRAGKRVSAHHGSHVYRLVRVTMDNGEVVL